MSRVVAIVGGTGPEGSGLAWRWAQAGETVIIGSREAARARAAADDIRSRAGAQASVSGEENAEVCRTADIIVLTIPFEAHAATLKHIKPALRPGCVVVDTTVPLAASVGGRATRTLGVWQGSAAQQAAELLPQVSVVGAFQSVSSEWLAQTGSIDCDVLVCGDDPAAVRLIRELASRIEGVRAIDGGKLENARILEQITALLIGLNIRHKGHSGLRITGLPDSAYTVAKP